MCPRKIRKMNKKVRLSAHVYLLKHAVGLTARNLTRRVGLALETGSYVTEKHLLMQLGLIRDLRKF